MYSSSCLATHGPELILRLSSGLQGTHSYSSTTHSDLMVSILRVPLFSLLGSVGMPATGIIPCLPSVFVHACSSDATLRPVELISIIPRMKFQLLTVVFELQLLGIILPLSIYPYDSVLLFWMYTLPTHTAVPPCLLLHTLRAHFPCYKSLLKGCQVYAFSHTTPSYHYGPSVQLRPGH